MRAVCLNCTLKRSPETSSSASLADVVLTALRDQGVETEMIRLADHQIEPGVVSEAVTDGDERTSERYTATGVVCSVRRA